MTVTLTSPVLGRSVGTDYTGELEDWLLAQGYARRTGYTGPGVQSTGATDVAPAADPRLPENREEPYWPLSEDHNTTIANDADNLTKESFPAPRFDVNPGGVDNDPPADLALEPAEGPAAGGTVVTITGTSLEGVTGVTFDGVAGTALDVSDAADGVVRVTSPVGTAGPADVVVTDPNGSATLTGGFTYTA